MFLADKEGRYHYIPNPKLRVSPARAMVLVDEILRSRGRPAGFRPPPVPERVRKSLEAKILANPPPHWRCLCTHQSGAHEGGKGKCGAKRCPCLKFRPKMVIQVREVVPVRNV